MTYSADLRRLRDNLHEDMVLLDRLIAEQDRIEEERDSYHDRMRSLRSIQGGAS